VVATVFLLVARRENHFDGGGTAENPITVAGATVADFAAGAAGALAGALVPRQTVDGMMASLVSLVPWPISTSPVPLFSSKLASKGATVPFIFMVVIVLAMLTGPLVDVGVNLSVVLVTPNLIVGV
jgi:hypothetical protein